MDRDTAQVSVVDGPTLGELATKANEEHDLAREAAYSALQHAIRSGEALIAAKERVELGGWERWLSENFHATYRTAFIYQRIAQYQDRIPENVTISKADEMLVGLSLLNKADPGVPKYPVEMREEAVKLIAEGRTQSDVADLLNVSQSFVSHWAGNANIAAKHRKMRAQRAREMRKRREAAALKQFERDKAVKRAGGGPAEAYSLLRKAAQTLDRAQEDTKDREQRTHLKEALSRLYLAEDQIVKALGLWKQHARSGKRTSEPD